MPLNKQAITILKAQIGKNLNYVFTCQGKPVTRCNNQAWAKALGRAGIDDFRWHDLRPTWASWHVQNGTPLHELQQLGGWSNYEMVLRYAHLSMSFMTRFCHSKWVFVTRLRANSLILMARSEGLEPPTPWFEA